MIADIASVVVHTVVHGEDVVQSALAHIYTLPQAHALITTETGITLEDTDVQTASDGAQAFMHNIFEVLKILPIAALVLGGKWVLGKVFGIFGSSEA